MKSIRQAEKMSLFWQILKTMAFAQGEYFLAQSRVEELEAGKNQKGGRKGVSQLELEFLEKTVSTEPSALGTHLHIAPKPETTGKLWPLITSQAMKSYRGEP